VDKVFIKILLIKLVQNVTVHVFNVLVVPLVLVVNVMLDTIYLLIHVLNVTLNAQNVLLKHLMIVNNVCFLIVSNRILVFLNVLVIHILMKVYLITIFVNLVTQE